MELKLNTVTFQQQIEYFNKYYSIIRGFHFNVNKKYFIGDKANRICRYCGKTKLDTTFSNVAHAFPEFVGNKLLFSNDECDCCNEHFSNNIENHFANFLGLGRTISQIAGKRGIPSYKTKDKLSRIDITQKGIEVNSSIDNEIFIEDEKNKSFKIIGYQEPYIPVAVYKCLTKMAISVMPSDELQHFQETLKWLFNPDHSQYIFKPLYLIFSFIPGINPFKFITSYLVRKKEESFLAPYLYFILAFNNYFFQIYVPTVKDKILNGVTTSVMPFPIPFDKNYKYGSPRHWIEDFSSYIPLKNQKMEFNMSYEDKSQI
jgi:hypothetical protein